MELKITSPSTVRDYIEVSVLPWVPSGFIGSDALAEIRETAAKLPGGMTNFFGFECMLSEADTNADLLVCSSLNEGARSILAGAHPVLKFPRELFQDDCWRRVFDFARSWNDPNSPLHERIHNIWLEFDTGKKHGDLSSPSLFFGAFDLSRSSGGAAPHNLQADCAWLTESALSVLHGRQLFSSEICQIARCIDALPPGACIFQVGVMLPRKLGGTRLCIRGLKPEKIGCYLRDAGWRGPRADLDVLIGSVSDHVESFALDLDVTSRIEPKIGLECYPAIEVGKAEQLLRHLAAIGFAREKKAEALCHWRGIVHERLSRVPWPNDLRASSALLNGGYHSMFYRRLHHVKIVHEPGKPVYAKAYLAVLHYWVEPNLLRRGLERSGSESSSASASRSLGEEKTAWIAGSPCSC